MASMVALMSSGTNHADFRNTPLLKEVTNCKMKARPSTRDTPWFSFIGPLLVLLAGGPPLLSSRAKVEHNAQFEPLLGYELAALEVAEKAHFLEEAPMLRRKNIQAGPEANVPDHRIFQWGIEFLSRGPHATLDESVGVGRGLPGKLSLG
jgi:hypothetical protein